MKRHTYHEPIGLLVAALAIVSIVSLLPLTTNAQPTAAPSSNTASDRLVFEKLARHIEPDLVGKPARLSDYVRFFRSQMVNDDRLFACEIEAEWQERVVKLTGFVEFIETRADLVNFFRALGFDNIDDQIEVLPADQLGKRRFGFVTAPHSLCYDRPTGQRENVTDCLLGDPLFLLKEMENGFLLCHTTEGYLGFIDGKHVVRATADEFRQNQTGARVRLLKDHQAADQPLLPAGARLKIDSRKEARYMVRLPNGRLASIPADCCQLVDDTIDPRVERVIQNGRRLLGTQYVWGGKSSAGIDCSGLVQVAFATEGVHLPRDSNQQVYLGRLTATRWYLDGMARGDTLYFLGQHGKIVHTAIYLGDGQYLESADRGVAIASLNRGDSNFNASRSKKFAFAKRLLE